MDDNTVNLRTIIQRCREYNQRKDETNIENPDIDEVSCGNLGSISPPSIHAQPNPEIQTKYKLGKETFKKDNTQYGSLPK